MEANVKRIPNATFTCVVSAPNLAEMGTSAWEACRAYFVTQAFEITDLDAEALQNQALQPIGYTARVHARAL